MEPRRRQLLWLRPRLHLFLQFKLLAPGEGSPQYMHALPVCMSSGGQAQQQDLP